MKWRPIEELDIKKARAAGTFLVWIVDLFNPEISYHMLVMVDSIGDICRAESAMPLAWNCNVTHFVLIEEPK